MITAIVQFKVPDGISRAEICTNMQNVAPRFESVPGLIRKSFLLDADNRIGGGVYTWENREAAENLYVEGGPWREAIRGLYGVDPEIMWYETPVVVDNAAGEIKTAA